MQARGVNEIRQGNRAKPRFQHLSTRRRSLMKPHLPTSLAVHPNRRPLDFQERECLIEEVVQPYLTRIAEGETLEPVTVRFDGESYFLQDGYHRVEAAQRSGLREIDVEIFPGTLQDMEAEFREMLRVIRADLRSGK